MKNYINLISQNIIDFEKLLLDKYYLLHLSEVETIILIKLHKNLKDNNTLQVSDLCQSMSINKDECGQIIINLVTKGFINLELSSVDSKETYNLKETYSRLALLLDNEDASLENQDNISLEKEVVKMLERELKKTLSSIELQIVSHWIYEYHYDYEEIVEVTTASLKNKSRGIKYIDRALYNKRKSEEQVSTKVDSSDVKDLFNKVYGKKQSNS